MLSDISNTLGTDCFEFVSKEAEDLQKGFVPGNTQRSMQWSMKVFCDWKKAREVALEEACSEDRRTGSIFGRLPRTFTLYIVNLRVPVSTCQCPGLIALFYL